MHGSIQDVYQRIRSNRQVVIRFAEKMDEGISVLRSSPSLRNLSIDESRVTAELETDDAGLADLLDEMIRRGVRIASYADQEPTLEDVFMMVTKGLVS